MGGFHVVEARWNTEAVDYVKVAWKDPVTNVEKKWKFYRPDDPAGHKNDEYSGSVVLPGDATLYFVGCEDEASGARRFFSSFTMMSPNSCKEHFQRTIDRIDLIAADADRDAERPVLHAIPESHGARRSSPRSGSTTSSCSRATGPRSWPAARPRAETNI